MSILATRLNVPTVMKMKNNQIVKGARVRILKEGRWQGKLATIRGFRIDGQVAVRIDGHKPNTVKQVYYMDDLEILTKGDYK